MTSFTCMIPALPEDYERTKKHYHRLFECLTIDKIVFVGPPELEAHVKKDYESGLYGEYSIDFLNERLILSFDEVKKSFLKQLSSDSTIDASSAGWYYQQFLKMEFANHCDSEYYLCWDADTIPLKPIEMFSPDGKPYFDVKTEFQEQYFITINRLFGYGKVIEKSFVSEHMLFNKAFMLDLIADIEKAPFEGATFYEKILNAAGSDNINLGFSEFETYGTWVDMHHSSAYKLRDWKSFRNTNFFVDISDITKEDIDWLSKDYDAASFEKYQETNETLNILFNDPRYRQKLSPQQFYQAILESGAMGDYSDGVIKSGNINAPT